MQACSKVNQRILVFLPVLACLMVVSSLSGSAVPNKQVAGIVSSQKITAACSIPIGPSVQVTEPRSVVPVLLTWNTDDTLTGVSCAGGNSGSQIIKSWLQDTRRADLKISTDAGYVGRAVSARVRDEAWQRRSQDGPPFPRSEP